MDDTRTMNQHFKKRKSRSSSAPVSPRRAACTAAPPNSSAGQLAPLTVTKTSPTASSSPVQSRSSSPLPVEGINLSAALTALKVSLKREMDSFIPPTPAASPVHARSAKRARFDFGVILPELNETRQDAAAASNRTTKASPVPKLRATAFLSVSKKLKQELERTARPDTSDHVLRARKRRQQLSFFAIASAFHRAAHERERAMVPAE